MNYKLKLVILFEALLGVTLLLGKCTGASTEIAESPSEFSQSSAFVANPTLVEEQPVGKLTVTKHHPLNCRELMVNFIAWMTMPMLMC